MTLNLLTAQRERTGKTVYREVDLHMLFQTIENDKSLQLERMTALAFHNKLNEYRSKNGKKTLYWDEKLCLAARNHNMYLLSVSDLSHEQTISTKYNTGYEPTNRIDFVTLNSKEFQFTGFENCAVSGDLYSKNLDILFAHELSWEEMVEKANEDADEMFKLWKTSSGHNKNMLDENHMAHGTSIIFNSVNEAVVGTSVFAQKQNFYDPDFLQLNFRQGWEKDFKINYKENYYPVKPSSNRLNRTIAKHSKYFSLSVEKKNILLDKRLTKLLKNAPEKESNTDLRKRYLKMTFYLGIFELQKHEIQQQFFLKSYEKNEFLAYSAITDLNEQLLKSPELDKAKKWSGDIKIFEESNGKLTLSIRTYLLVKKD